MIESKPILSICIPTYNRAEFLDKTLESIVIQNAFLNTNDVEIVIADNCSEDNTSLVVKKYTDIFPEKIIYIKNEANIGAVNNYENALSLATGTFAKLHNDYLLIKKGALSTIVDIITENIEEKPIIFFLNGKTRKQEKTTICKNLNEFVSHVSYFSTWIGGFGIWQDDFKKSSNFSRYYKLLLVQTDFLFRLLAMGKQAIVCNENYFINIPFKKNVDYNIAEVFGQNYLFLFKEYLNNDLLEERIFQQEKKLLLINQIIPHYIKFNIKFDIKTSGFFCFLKDYKYDCFFYLALIFYPALFIHNKLRGIIKRLFSKVSFLWVYLCNKLPIKLASFENNIFYKIYKIILWRVNNLHNETFPINIFDQKKVSVGKKTYGGLKVYMFGHLDEKLIIGNYVSIASGVTFLLGGEHSYEGFSTYPFLVKLLGQEYEAKTKGPVIVEDDVWIGINSLILSGIKIGKGSVIAAGSVVTKDVSAYSIVGGNPARVIKYRFEKEIITELSRLDFSKLEDETLINNKDLIYQKLDKTNVKSIVDKLKNS